MSATQGQRKRAKQACIPCHKRKRKCDGKYPCGVCVTYEYSCSYVDISDTSRCSRISRAYASRSATRVRVETANGESNSNAAVQDAYRQAGPSSAMEYPHVLSTALDAGNSSNNAFRMHSFAYNFGIRSDEPSETHVQLKELISEDDLSHYSDTYFSTMSSTGDVVNQKIYTQRCRDYYHKTGSAGSSQQVSLAFSAMAAGVAAVGSFLSAKRHPRESDLVQYAKSILDDPISMHSLEVDHIVAWASCTCMHVCEAIGLNDEANIKKISSTADAAALGHDNDRLRRVFWILWAGHTLLSYECDRSFVHFRTVTTAAIMPVPGSVADQFVQIAQIIPAPNSPFYLSIQPSTQVEEMFERLKALHEIHVSDPFLLVTKADVAFCFYRRVYQLKMGIPDNFIQLVIENGNAAIESAEYLVQQGRFLWNAIGSVFHYVCVLIAINNPIASVHIAAAFKGLKSLAVAADTSHTREALSMAQHLLDLHLASKREELSQLEQIRVDTPPTHRQPQHENITHVSDFGYGFDWDQFLFAPYTSLFNTDILM